MPPSHSEAVANESPTTPMGNWLLVKATRAVKITASTLSPTIRPEASSTPSCFVASGFAVLSAPLSNHQPTSAPTVTISVDAVGR